MGPSLLQPGRQSHCQQCPQCRADTTLRLKHAHMLNLVTTISPCTNTILNQVGRPCPFCPLDTERTCKNPCPFRVQRTKRTKRTKRTRPTDTDRIKIRPTLEFFKNPCPFRVQRTKRTRPTGGRAVVGWAPYSQNPTDFGVFQKSVSVPCPTDKTDTADWRPGCNRLGPIQSKSDRLWHFSKNHKIDVCQHF